MTPTTPTPALADLERRLISVAITTKPEHAPLLIEAVKALASSAAQPVAARELDVEAERRKLDAARKWIASAQHGENCFLHDEGEYDRCFCGKDALEAYLESEPESAPVSTEQAGDAQEGRHA